ncbi:MAG TPA: hypothetical protein VII92_03260 [Anaerolineae bacterium]
MTKHSQKVVSRKQPRIPIWLPLIAVAGLAMIIVAAATSNNPASATQPTLEVHGAPALKVDQEKVDFGDVKLGRTVEVKFQVTNAGDQMLIFKKTPYVQVVEVC